MVEGVAAGITGTQAFLAAAGGIPITEPLVDQSQVGNAWARVSVFISANPSYSRIPIQLPRQPSFFMWVDDSGAVVYQTGPDRAASSPSVLQVRATVSTVASLLVY